MATNKLHLGRGAKALLEQLFLRKNDDNKVVETPEQLFRRIARAVAAAEIRYKQKDRVDRLLKKHNKLNTDFWWLISNTKELDAPIKKDKDVRKAEEEFYELMISLDFLPSSTIMFNAGKSMQLAACAVLNVGDNIDEIFGALRKTALLHHTGAGVSLSFSRLRPKNDIIKGAPSGASGPASFMEVFESEGRQLSVGGKQRGTLLFTLRADHPDFKDFAETSTAPRVLSVTDKFMDGADENSTYPIINPYTGKAAQRENVAHALSVLCDAILKGKNIGLFFADEAARHNPTPRTGPIEIPTPFGEAALVQNEALVLGSINLANMVKNGAITFDRLKAAVWKGIHFLDNTIDVCDYIFAETKELAHANRKIGLGIMGFADLLVEMKLKYTSDKALQLAEELMKFIDEEAKKASAAIAQERGLFPNFQKSVYNTKKKEDRVRNATRTAITSTSTLSMIAGCSRGIEPAEVVIKSTDGRAMVNPRLLSALKGEEVLSGSTLTKITEQGNLKGVFIPAWVKKVFVTAEEMPAEWHIKMQAAFQNHCDNGVAKKIYLNPEATMGEVIAAIKLGYELDCKTLMFAKKAEEQKIEKCEKCGGDMLREGKCLTCMKCGFGKCEI